MSNITFKPNTPGDPTWIDWYLAVIPEHFNTLGPDYNKLKEA